MPARKIAKPRLVGCGRTLFPGEDGLEHGRCRGEVPRISVKNQSNIRMVCSELMRQTTKVRLPVAGISAVEGRGQQEGGRGKVRY